jgi:GntR family carbon starvation induced transcriptional regulator
MTVVPIAASRIQRGTHRSLRSAICDALRGDIIEARLEPGKLLSIKELQAQYGVGLSAVREALCQLAADGLVIAEDQRGFRVAPISAEDLEDLSRSRIEIESFAIRDAIANGDTEWEAQLLASYHRMIKAPHPLAQSPSQGRSSEYALQHRRFHDLLVAPCTCEWMKRFRGTLHEHSERYRRLAAAHFDGRDIDGEHRDLMAAAIARDADRAVALIADHVRMTGLILTNRGFTA